jgi:hypothetical protein
MRAGCAVSTAGRIAGVAPSTVHKWLTEGEREPDGRYGAWTRDVRRLQGEHIAAAERLHATHRETNPQACQWYLSRIARETYGDESTTVIVDERAPLPIASPADVRRAIKGET